MKQLSEFLSINLKLPINTEEIYYISLQKKYLKSNIFGLVTPVVLSMWVAPRVKFNWSVIHLTKTTDTTIFAAEAD